MIVDIKTGTVVEGDCFLIDTNILLYLFCPIGNYRSDIVAGYSNFINLLSKKKCCLYITSQILSEFVNRYLRTDFEIYKKTSGKNQLDYKIDYKKSVTYHETYQTLLSTLNHILKLCNNKLDDQFSCISVDEILRYGEQTDFNDAYFMEILRKETKTIKLLTNDSDFSYYKNSHIIYTSNPKLISLN